MTEQHLMIKVIKRAERERSEQQDAGGVGAELSAREKARAVVATVKQWIGESRQAREERSQESRQQLGWSCVGHGEVEE